MGVSNLLGWPCLSLTAESPGSRIPQSTVALTQNSAFPEAETGPRGPNPACVSLSCSALSDWTQSPETPLSQRHRLASSLPLGTLEGAAFLYPSAKGLPAARPHAVTLMVNSSLFSLALGFFLPRDPRARAVRSGQYRGQKVGIAVGAQRPVWSGGCVTSIIGANHSGVSPRGLLQASALRFFHFCDCRPGSLLLFLSYVLCLCVPLCVHPHSAPCKVFSFFTRLTSCPSPWTHTLSPEPGRGIGCALLLMAMAVPEAVIRPTA